jgi:ferric-dicitrate binding protein FerR (iron transport regulator)
VPIEPRVAAATRGSAHPGTARLDTVPDVMTPVAPQVPPGRRLRGDILLAVVVVLLALVVAWWWSFAGEGRQRFRADEPTPAEPVTPPTG